MVNYLESKVFIYRKGKSSPLWRLLCLLLSCRRRCLLLLLRLLLLLLGNLHLNCARYRRIVRLL